LKLMTFLIFILSSCSPDRDVHGEVKKKIILSYLTFQHSKITLFNTFIRQRHVQLIRNGSKDIYDAVLLNIFLFKEPFHKHIKQYNVFNIDF